MHVHSEWLIMLDKQLPTDTICTLDLVPFLRYSDAVTDPKAFPLAQFGYDTR